MLICYIAGELLESESLVMKIGIIGTGNVAANLGKALTHKGYHVMFGSRTVAKSVELAGKMEHYATGGTIASAVQYGEIVILAVPYKALESILSASDNFRSKVIIDCTNPIDWSGGMPALAFGQDTSAAEQIAKMLPEAQVVKAFNAVYSAVMSSPYFGAHDASMFYCGDDATAKKAVTKLIADIGFDAVDAGPLHSARLLEPLAVLLLRLAHDRKAGEEIAFKLLSR